MCFAVNETLLPGCLPFCVVDSITFGFCQSVVIFLLFSLSLSLHLSFFISTHSFFPLFYFAHLHIILDESRIRNRNCVRCFRLFLLLCTYTGFVILWLVGWLVSRASQYIWINRTETQRKKHEQQQPNLRQRNKDRERAANVIRPTNHTILVAIHMLNLIFKLRNFLNITAALHCIWIAC